MIFKSHELRSWITLCEDVATELVFVYGSLKRGFHNDPLLAHARFIGTAKTAPRFDLLDLGMFPAAIVGKNSLIGEVFEVNHQIMQNLDRLESNGSLYLRKQIPVTLKGKQISVWIYLYLQDDGHDPLVEPDGRTVAWLNSR